MIKAIRLAGVLVAVLLISNGNAQEIFRRKSGLFSTDDIVISEAARSARRIVVYSARQLSGKLTITAVDSDSVRVVYSKQAKSSNKSQAIDFIDLISVLLDVGPETAKVELRAPNPAPWSGTNYSGRVEAEVFVPLGSQVEIDALVFDVTVVGPIDELLIPESLGRLQITGVTKNLDVVTANRRVTLDSISGSISAATSNSTLIARAITSSTEQARFRNQGGDIQIDGLSGSINIKSSFGRIKIEDFRPSGQSSFIRGSSAPILVAISQISDGKLVVSNRHEDIEIYVPDSISAYFSLSVGDDGVIEATNFPFIADQVQRNRLNLLAGDGLADISGSIRGAGSIFVRARGGD